MRCSFRTHQFSRTGLSGRCPGLVCDAHSGHSVRWRFRFRGPTAFPASGRHRVPDSVGLPRSRRRAVIAFPIPWAYRVPGFMPQSYFESHALRGHRIPAQGANPGETPIKTNPRPEGTPHRSPYRTPLGRFEFAGFESPPSHPPLEGCGPQANCGNRGQRTRLQWRRRRLRCGFLSGFSVAGVADPGAARSVKRYRIRRSRRASRRTPHRTCFWVRFQRVELDSGWRILAQTVNPFVKYWRARQIR